MYLKRLEIHGFKSFADKIVLEFGKGISAVVGPNGSGKSNISDAVRWALGEQSMKSLRGQKTEDVIFAGTELRKPLSYAEVSLVIDNSDLVLSSEYSEVTVTRRVYRSGESKFMINNVAVRLKDIHELFMDTGIGREGYSIIGQGKIDEILSIRSEDRRNLFEEAAGIAKYKTRRGEAMSRLEREAQNLVRINDMIDGIEEQLGPLEAHSEKAKRFLKLAERLKLVEINTFVNKVGKVRADISKFDAGISDVGANIEGKQSEQQKNKEIRDKLAAELEETEAKIAEKNEAVQNLMLDSEKNESRIKLSEQKAEFCESECVRLNNEIVMRKNSVEEIKKEQSGYAEKAESAEAEHKVRLSASLLKQDEVDAIAQAISAAEAHYDKFNADHVESLQKTGDLQAKIRMAEMLYEQLEERAEQLSEDREGTLRSIEDIGKKKSEAEQAVFDNERQRQRLSRDFELHIAEKERHDKHRLGLKEKYDSLIGRNKELVSRRKILSDMEAAHEGYSRGVKSVLGAKSGLKGVIGAVGELVSTEEKYRTAIEVALGAAVQNIITKTENDAKAAIEYLKRTKDGRVTFLPIESVRGKGLGAEKERLLFEKGVVGAAKDLIKCNDVYDGVFTGLLGRVIIVDNFDNAVAFSKKYGYTHKVVTLDGELFSVGGSITGGSLNAAFSGIIGRADEIKRLSREIEQNASELKNSDSALHDTDLKLSGITDTLEKIKYRLRETELSDNTEKTKLAGYDTQLSELKQKELYQHAEEKQNMEKIRETNAEIRRLQQTREQVLAETQEILRNAEKQRDSIKESKKLLDARQRELTTLKVEAASLKETVAALRSNIERTHEEIRSVYGFIDTAYADIETQSALISEKRKEAESIRKHNEELAEQLNAMRAELLTLEAEKDDISDEISGLRAVYDENLEALAALNNELTRFELKKEQTEADVKNLCDDMWEKYNVTYHSALSPEYERLDLSPLALSREEGALKNEIKSLGTVNVAAIEEFAVLSERYAFMKKQRDDILDAEKKLRDIILDLTKLMEERFNEQLEAISESFGQVFSEMFQGGRAYLKLQDPDNILESGIDIISQPPGKNLQNMMLFSGGERALTAIALLFGILRLKPSPFCILDEIEAALDDSNVNRFANYIKNINMNTQFILITHRKGTMEVSDVLYGVTMQEPGVSKLVSVSLSEAIR